LKDCVPILSYRCNFCVIVLFTCPFIPRLNVGEGRYVRTGIIASGEMKHTRTECILIIFEGRMEGIRSGVPEKLQSLFEEIKCTRRKNRAVLKRQLHKGRKRRVACDFKPPMFSVIGQVKEKRTEKWCSNIPFHKFQGVRLYSHQACKNRNKDIRVINIHRENIGNADCFGDS